MAGRKIVLAEERAAAKAEKLAAATALEIREKEKARPKRRNKTYAHQNHVTASRNVVLYLEEGLPTDATPLERLIYKEAVKDPVAFLRNLRILERQWMASPRRKLNKASGRPFGSKAAEPDDGTQLALDMIEEWFTKQEMVGYGRSVPSKAD